MFTYLSTDEKTKRIMHFWKRCALKLTGAVKLSHKLRDLRIKVLVSGRHNAVKHKQIINEEEVEPSCIIMPENKYKRWWNVYVGLLLLYTGIFVPLRVSFYDDASTFMIVFETLIDCCFFVDIVLTFFSAYERKNNVIETRHRQIAIQYFKGWFWIDALSTVPFQLIEMGLESESGGDLKMTRITRLPRLYRIVRILRLIKLARLSKRGGFLN